MQVDLTPVEVKALLDMVHSAQLGIAAHLRALEHSASHASEVQRKHARSEVLASLVRKLQAKENRHAP